MRNILSQLLVIVFVCANFFTISAQAGDIFNFDPTHSYILFHINHFGFSNPSGKWFFTGTLNLDQTKPQNSTVKVTIQMADLTTGVVALDDHLKGKLFFDVAQYPTATFVSDKVTVTGKDTAKVQGMLTLHGVTKPVTLDVKLNKIGMNPITEKNSAGFSATTQIKRSDFDINTLLPDVGDEVKIEIEAEAGVAPTTPPVAPTPTKVAG